MLFKILVDESTKPRIFIPLNFYGTVIPYGAAAINIYAGLKSEKAEIVVDKRLDENQIKMSQGLLELLSIPAELQYQIKPVSDGISMGPVIGLLMAQSNKRLKRGFLKGLLDYTHIYSTIGGLLCVFSAEGIDYNNRLIEGYCYEPDSREIWHKGIFPFPSSIYRRITLPKDAELKLKQITGNRVFNTGYFDKWQFWKMSSKYDDIREHLPFTRHLSSFEDIEWMLKKYESAYLKPVNGTLARGLMKLTLTKDGIRIKSNSDDKPMETMTTAEEARVLIKGIVGKRPYLVQQALTPISINDRFVDFRVIMQKDNKCMWVCTGITGFLGNQGSICSNWGYQTTFENLIAKSIIITKEEITKKRQEVISICKKVCEMLDASGEHYGDLGFDVLIDKSLKVWVLEVNKRHYHIVPLWAGDIKTYYEVKNNPIKYATALSGFKVE